ncbi:MAG: hypothetical protein M3340_05990, partial [Actinomycetota bacterium]|nr:hypothetical protein [Actinomycetota bacterium]
MGKGSRERYLRFVLTTDDRALGKGFAGASQKHGRFAAQTEQHNRRIGSSFAQSARRAVVGA